MEWKLKIENSLCPHKRYPYPGKPDACFLLIKDDEDFNKCICDINTCPLRVR